MSAGILNIVPIDFAILFVLWIIFSIVALQGGRGEVISIMIGGFIGLVLSEYLEKAFWISDVLSSVISEPRNAAILFLAFVVLGYLGIRQMMLPYGSDLLGSPAQSATLGFLTTVILLAIWMIAPHTDSIWQFSPLFETAFDSIYTFWWIVAGFGLAVVFG